MRRIAYVNPYVGLAEDQAFYSLKAAGEGLGLELVQVLPSELKEDDDFEFVITTTAATRKTTSHPTYLSVHTPRLLYVDTDEVFSSTNSYDGYLCISDSLARLFSHWAESRGLDVIAPGFYYNSPQIVDLAADLPASAAVGELSLCYFGTNWDVRAERLFTRLSDRAYMRVYGPEKAWRMIPRSTYKGATAFDGLSVQREYQRYGVGFVSLSQEHLLDDIVSNRVFEIASVGACAICPDTAWMRDNFGDTVFYYDPFSPPEAIVAEVDAIMAQIAADPAAAGVKAREARAVFEQRFHAGAMLANADAYHQALQHRRAERAAVHDDTLIDIVIRTGGRSLDFLMRAVRSIDGQTAGRFRLIVVRYKPVDLEPLLAQTFQRIHRIDVVDLPGGNRSQTLVAGLDRIEADYFALLDDDDYLLDSHFQGLLQVMGSSQAPYRFAYSDILKRDEGRPVAAPWDNGLSVLKEGPAWGDIHTLLQRFSPHCFLATSNTLALSQRAHWRSHTAEDVLLISSLLKVATPLHSPGATCVYSVGRSDTSDYLNDPNRLEDELALVTGIGQYFQAIEQKFPDHAQDTRGLIYPVLRRLMEGRREAIQKSAGGQPVLGQWVALEAGETTASPAHLLDHAQMVFVEVPLSPDRISGNGVLLADGGDGGPVRAQAQKPWELSLIVDIGDYALEGCTTSATATFDGLDEPIAFGLVDSRAELNRKVNIPSSRFLIQAAAGGLGGAPMHAAALQAGSRPPSQPFVLRSLHVGYDLAELAVHFDMPAEALTPEAALAKLKPRLLRQVLNAPAPDQQGAAQPIDFRGRRSVFRYLVQDGRYAAGAARVLRTGLGPWDYFAQVYVSAEQLSAARWLHLQIESSREPFYVLVADSAFQGVSSDRLLVRAHKQHVDVWLDVSAISGDGFLVLQNSASPRDTTLALLKVEAVL